MNERNLFHSDARPKSPWDHRKMEVFITFFHEALSMVMLHRLPWSFPGVNNRQNFCQRAEGTGSEWQSDLSVTHKDGRGARLDGPNAIYLTSNPQLLPPHLPNKTRIMLYFSFRDLKYKVCLKIPCFPTNFFVLFPCPSGNSASPLS